VTNVPLHTVTTMNLVLVIIAPFPLGFILHNRTAAFIAYLAVAQFVFTVQTAWLLLDWGGGDEAAFGGPFPDHDVDKVLGYVAINAIIFVVGLGLVTLGARLGRNRRAKANRVELTH
jgi:hypothetical protein